MKKLIICFDIYNVILNLPISFSEIDSTDILEKMAKPLHLANVAEIFLKIGNKIIFVANRISIPLLSPFLSV